MTAGYKKDYISRTDSRLDFKKWLERKMGGNYLGEISSIELLRSKMPVRNAGQQNEVELMRIYFLPIKMPAKND